MNRRQRRDHQRRLRTVDTAIRTVMAKSEADGRPWHVYGMTHACSDCGATADLHGRGRDGPVLADIWHDDGCPAAGGTVTWQPVPIDF